MSEPALSDELDAGVDFAARFGGVTGNSGSMVSGHSPDGDAAGATTRTGRSRAPSP